MGRVPEIWVFGFRGRYLKEMGCEWKLNNFFLHLIPEMFAKFWWGKMTTKLVQFSFSPFLGLISGTRKTRFSSYPSTSLLFKDSLLSYPIHLSCRLQVYVLTLFKKIGKSPGTKIKGFFNWFVSIYNMKWI